MRVSLLVAATCSLLNWTTGQTYFAYGEKTQFGKSVSTFAPETYLGVTLADLDRDGDLDVLATRDSSGWGGPLELVAAFNDGRGIFGDFQPFGAIPITPRYDSSSSPLSAFDVNGDGWQDVICEDEQGQGPLWLTTASGFAPLAPPAGRFVDVDGDGDLDVFGASGASARLWLFRQNIFVEVTATHLPTMRPNHHAFGDVDGDHDLDLMIHDGSAYRLYLNDGNGRFTAKGGPSPVTTLQAPSSFALADVDGDGDADFVGCHCSYPREAWLYLNEGQPTFRDVSSRMPSGLDWRFEDLDDDGFIDVIASISTNPWVWIHYRNDGRGTFAPSSLPVDLVDPQQHRTTAVYEARGDINGDGRADRVIVTAGGRGNTSYTWGTAQAFVNDRGQRFVDTGQARLPPYETSVAGCCAGDVDGDGDADAILIADSAVYHSRSSLLRNRGDGTFAIEHPPLPKAPVNDQYRPHIQLVDVDRDGDLDLVVGGGIWINGGRGSFQDQTASRVLGLPSFGLTLGQAFGDVDGDGDLDLALGTDQGCFLLRNDGAGRFAYVSAALSPNVAECSAVTMFDSDQDGDLDIYVAEGGYLTSPAADRLYRNLGSFAFTEAVGAIPNNPTHASNVLVADFDADGRSDLLLVSYLAVGSGSPALLLRNQGGTFAARWLGGSAASVAALVDANEDGALDVVVDDAVGSGATRLGLLLNDGHANFSFVGGFPYHQVAPACSLGSADFDQDGDQDLLLLSAEQDWVTLAVPQVFYQHRHQLRTPALPRLGGPYLLETGSRRGDAREEQLAVVVASASRSGAYLQTPFGRFGLDPSTMFVVASGTMSVPAGSRTDSVVIPLLSELIGQEIPFQALTSPVSNLAAARLTNVVAESILR